MRGPWSPWTRAFLVWTVVFLAAAILVAFDAMLGLYRAEEACYFQVAPCPVAGDPDLRQLEFAVFGIPLIWVAGVVVGGIARAFIARRRARQSPEGPV